MKLRHHTIGPDEDQDSLFSFLPPIIADETQPTVQVFFRKKEHLNSASMCHVLKKWAHFTS